MTKTTHMWVGALFGILCAKFANDAGIIHGILENTEVIAGSIAGALCPDIDHPGSFLGRRVFFISKPMAAAAKACLKKSKRAKTSKSKIFWGNMAHLFAHRGLFHMLFLYLFLMGCSWLLIEPPLIKILATAMCIGCISHIFADMFNPSGIAILQPFCWKRFSFANIQVRSGAEFVFKIATILLCGISSTWALGWLNGLLQIMK